MALLTGSFNNSGSPVIKVSIYGVFQQSQQEFEAIIDTGFTGFVSMPLVQAFALGLVLTGTTTTILADGSQAFKLTALGTVVLGEETEVGLILLSPTSTDILVGMEFIRTFKRTLLVSEKGFVLIDNEEISKVFEQTIQKAAPK